MSLADALRRNGRERDSLPHYAEVIARSPAISQAAFGYAMALVRLGRYREARDRLDAAMTTYADQPGFAHALARLLAAAPDDSVRDGARAMTLMQALLLNQRTLELMQTMAMTMAETGRFEDAVRWQRDGHMLKLSVTIPANSLAVVHVPAADPSGVRESGNPIDMVRHENGATVYPVSSGRYDFESSLA
jgi:hypothetical protein